MRILLQRVKRGSVSISGELVSGIGRGYVLLVGIGDGDTESACDKLAEKIVNLRLFPDDDDKFDRSLLDVEGEVLVISQFTLYGDTRKGRRPSFSEAARPELAAPLCDYFADKLSRLGVKHVATGRFGAMMEVEIVNDGPVTLWLES